MEDFPAVSIIIPVRNEAAILKRCLASLSKLDYPRERLEIIISDGLSSDNIAEVIREFGVSLVINDKQIVVSARNCGFARARGEFVAFTDADCTFSPDWIKNSIKYFRDDKVAGVTGPTLIPQDSSSFEKAVGFLFWNAGLLGGTAHRGSVAKTEEIKDIPGCNAIYRTEALNKVMPIDENLLTAEDVWMNFCLREYGYKLISADDVRVWHYRRSNFKRFMRQVYRFAIGRQQVARKNPKLLSPLHVIAGLSLPVFLGLGLILYFSGYFSLFLALSFFVLLFFFLFGLLKVGSLKTALDIPLVLVIFLSAWSIGFLRELFFPLKDVKGK